MGNQRVLVISHNAFSTSNNMGKTLASLFYTFEAEEIAQLYFHSYNPNVNCSSSWYQITDFDVIKSIIRRKRCGRITSVAVYDNIDDDSFEAKVYKYGKNHSPFKLLARDVIWKLGKWKTKALFQWIETFKPTSIFFASGYSMFAYDVALFISKKYQIPIVTYFCDDYYNENIKTVSPIYWIRKILFKNKVAKIINRSSNLVFISKTMENEYFNIFGKRGVTLMTPQSISFEDKNIINKPLVISYIGNVLLGRWKVLKKIAQAVTEINSNGTKISLEIYSGNATEEIIREFNLGGNDYYKGKLSSQGVKEKIEESDILIHVESFEKIFIEKTRHSISTKIADSLASNRAILAVGPREVASIQYLSENQAAYIINDENQIEKRLVEYFVDNEIDREIIFNAKKIAERNHSINTNSEKLKCLLKETNMGG